MADLIWSGLAWFDPLFEPSAQPPKVSRREASSQCDAPKLSVPRVGTAGCLGSRSSALSLFLALPHPLDMHGRVSCWWRNCCRTATNQCLTPRRPTPACREHQVSAMKTFLFGHCLACGIMAKLLPPPLSQQHHQQRGAVQVATSVTGPSLSSVHRVFV
ncbi:hypothetical protein LZ30DRAFT_197605 [Colletotrichum cereale]|nr:hypothetical protein LZ30DRAFT_197605 [Colletotrichum cereale]